MVFIASEEQELEALLDAVQEVALEGTAAEWLWRHRQREESGQGTKLCDYF